MVMADLPVKKYFDGRNWEESYKPSVKNTRPVPPVERYLYRPMINYRKDAIALLVMYNQTLTVTLLVIAAAIASGKARWRMLGHLIVGLIFSSALVWLGKLTVVRTRPRWFKGSGWYDTFVGFSSGNHRFETQSFPSGDAAVAFTVSLVLGCYFPKQRWLLLLLAAGCAATRVIREYHYVSDALLGAFIGYAAAQLAAQVFRSGKRGTGEN